MKTTSRKISTSVLLTALTLTLLPLAGISIAQNPENSAPEISGDPPLIVEVGQVYDFVPQASDIDGDALYYSVNALPPWLMFDSSSGAITGIPAGSDIGTISNIEISVSDGNFTTPLAMFSIDVLSPPMGAENFHSEGVVVETDTGYQSLGDMAMRFHEGAEQTLRDADLELSFDDSGTLVGISGETLVPLEPVPNVKLEGDYRAEIGMYYGWEINNDEDIDITLKDERQYLVYFLGTEVNIVVGDENGEENSERLTISTPASGKVVLISDLYDPMFYSYGEIPFVGAAGRGHSLHGLIPFVPDLGNEAISEFDGHELINGSVSMGIKAVDLLNFTGERVERKPSLLNIDFDNPFALDSEYKVGFNGAAEFAFSVFGFGLFSFDLAQASAMLDVGFDQQSLVMHSLIDPDMAWAPEWMTVVADSQLETDIVLTGAGDVDMTVTGRYRSTLPEAEVEGSIHADLDSVTLSGEIVDRVRLPISLEFSENETHGSVGINLGFNDEISAAVDASFDRAEAEYERALQSLEDAIGDYEFEVSLRGLRDQLPVLVDTLTARLNAIPNTLRNQVDSAIVSAIKKKRVCKKYWGIKYCANAKNYVNEARIGDTAGTSARNIARQRVAPYIDSLEELKRRAQQADSATFRAALEEALRTVYAKRRINTNFKVTAKLGSFKVGPVKINFGSVSKSVSINQAVLNASQASQILSAANNIYRIGETQSVVISTNDALESLPSTEVIQQVREDVANEVKVIPEIESVNFSVIDGQYSASAMLSNGSTYSIAANVLSLDEALPALGDLLSESLIKQ